MWKVYLCTARATCNFLLRAALAKWNCFFLLCLACCACFVCFACLDLLALFCFACFACGVSKMTYTTTTDVLALLLASSRTRMRRTYGDVARVNARYAHCPSVSDTCGESCCPCRLGTQDVLNHRGYIYHLIVCM